MLVIRGQNGLGSLQASHSIRSSGFACAACGSAAGTTCKNVRGVSGKVDVAMKYNHAIIKITKAAPSPLNKDVPHAYQRNILEEI